MLDNVTSDNRRDENVASFLLQRSIQGAGFDAPRSGAGRIKSSSSTPDGRWSIEKLRNYISVVREKFRPSLHPDAAELLERYYRECRAAAADPLAAGGPVPVTVRFLESLVRLTQAHARLLYRDEATLADACAAVLLTICTVHGLHMEPDRSLWEDPVLSDFPRGEEADREFKDRQGRLLERFGMRDRLGDDGGNGGGGGGNGDGAGVGDLYEGCDPPHLGVAEGPIRSTAPPIQPSQLDCWGRNHTQISSPYPQRYR